MDDSQDTIKCLSAGRQNRAGATQEALQAFVRASGWARDLRPSTIDSLLAATSVRELSPGEVLCRQGKTATHWYGVMGGLLRVDTLCCDGTVASLAAGPMGTWFGEDALLLRKVRQYDVTAMRASRVACMSASAFRRAFDEDAQFNHAMAHLLSTHLDFLAKLFADQRRLDVERRIARVLVTMVGYSPHGPHLQVDVTQDELAQLAGVSRQRASQALHQLQAWGLLSLSRTSITVLDLAELGSAC